MDSLHRKGAVSLRRFPCEADLFPPEVPIRRGRRINQLAQVKGVAYPLRRQRERIPVDRVVACQELTRDHYGWIGEKGLASGPGVRVACEEDVEDAVRDLVGGLDRMPLGDRLEGEQMASLSHDALSSTKRMVQPFASAIAFASSTDMWSSAAM